MIRQIAVYNLKPNPGDVLDHILPANGLPRVGVAMEVVAMDGSSATWTAHVSSVDRAAGTYSVTVDGALTRREAQVLRLLARGLTRAQIGEALGIEVSTVAQHLNHIYAKLEMSGREEAAEWAERLEL